MREAAAKRATESGFADRSMQMISAKPWFIRARLRTRHLLLLTAIGEEGNIHRAAELLNMSQPAASRLLSDLEEIIGTELFERLPRGVRANWFGESLIRHARVALSSLREAASEIDSLRAGQTGQVTIGAIAGPAISLIPRAVSHITREHPLVRIQLQVDSSDRLLDSLQEGKIHLMVGRLLEGHDQANFTYTRLADEPVCAVVRQKHPLLSRVGLSLSELSKLSWIVPPVGSILRHRFDLMFREADLDAPRQIIETGSPMVAARLLEETDFLAVLPVEVAQYFSSGSLIARLNVPLPCKMDSYGVITRKDWPLSPAARLMHQALIDSLVPEVSKRRATSRIAGAA
jgi:DNA-binding transcriptional LysR family regulator